MMSTSLSRRRFIAIAAAMPVLPLRSLAGAMPSLIWRGVALGAEASLTIEHEDEREGRAAIDAALAEVARLEAIFSLHRPDSALSRLNETGSLDAAPSDLRTLLAQALQLAKVTGGAFDPTIQPLWALYANHFANEGADPAGPDQAAISDARAKVGWQKVAIDGGAVRLAAPGMALTLNGIAQGYITDRVGDILRARGFNHVLVNMGEQLALGPKRSGEAWRVGIANPAIPGQILEQVPLRSGAVATSAGNGCRFDARGRFTHILDPRNGHPARALASVTVIAGSATLADGLSTALSVRPDAFDVQLSDDSIHAFVVPAGATRGHWL